MHYHIDPRLLAQVPEFRRGVVVASGCVNDRPSPDLETLLRNRIALVEDSPSLTPDDARIQAWTELYKRFPSPKGERVRPSVWSLVRRIKKGDGARIPFVSPLVAISNLVALTYLVPSGLVDAAQVKGTLTLGFAEGTEPFLAFGKDEHVTVAPGEVIYYDDASAEVMCRAWNSRGGPATGIRPDTETAIIDVDALLSVIPATQLEEATEWAAGLVRDYCGAATQTLYLDAEHPTATFEIDASPRA